MTARSVVNGQPMVFDERLNEWVPDSPVERDFCKALCAVLRVDAIVEVLKVYLKLRDDRQGADDEFEI